MAVKQGPSKRRGEAYVSVRRASERSENDAREKARLGAPGLIFEVGLLLCFPNESTVSTHRSFPL